MEALLSYCGADFPVNYRIRHQMSGKNKIVHVTNLRAVHTDNVWDQRRDKYELVVPDELEQEPSRLQPTRQAKMSHPPAYACNMEDDDAMEWSEEDDIPLGQLFPRKDVALGDAKRDVPTDDTRTPAPAQASDVRSSEDGSACTSRTHLPMTSSDTGMPLPRKRRRMATSPSREDTKRYREDTSNRSEGMDISSVSLIDILQKPIAGLCKFLGIFRD